MSHRKFILLADNPLRPVHGINAIRTSADDSDAAVRYFNTHAPAEGWQWFQLIDRDTWEIVCSASLPQPEPVPTNS